MRRRAIALAIVVFAGLDLLFLTAAPLFGLVEIPGGAAGPWTIVVLAVAFFLALLSLVGALSVLTTDFAGGIHAMSAFRLFCRECGREPKLELGFCADCGAVS